MAIELIDTHAHLHAEEFDADRGAVLERAVKAGVTRIILIGAGTGWISSARALALAQQHDFLWASVGVHPNSASEPLDRERLLELGKSPKVVAIGETGLDYYRNAETAPAQIEWFRAHISVATELKKPIIVHSRNTGPECLQVLKDSTAAEVGGVFHCYAEDANFAAELATLNFRVSFPGIVTFKNADAVRDAVRQIPLSQILLETDAPYLAPVPYRGKRCESAFMVETARVIAEIKGVPLEELARITSDNALQLFRLD